MEVDSGEQAAAEGKLLSAFRSLCTSDKDMLVSEFQRMIQPSRSLSASTAEFFLDMTDWNLQQALCHYYDYGIPGDLTVPLMRFVKDVTIGEGESVPPDTDFVKTWRIENPGVIPWPVDCCLHKMEGMDFSSLERIPVPELGPGEATDVSVNMRSPSAKGSYQSQWRMLTSEGLPFGEPIWCILTVDECGVLGVTQQLANTSWAGLPAGGVPLSSCPSQPPLPNPFNNHSSFSQFPQQSDDPLVFGNSAATTSSAGGLMVNTYVSESMTCDGNGGVVPTSYMMSSDVSSTTRLSIATYTNPTAVCAVSSGCSTSYSSSSGVSSSFGQSGNVGIFSTVGTFPSVTSSAGVCFGLQQSSGGGISRSMDSLRAGIESGSIGSDRNNIGGISTNVFGLGESGLSPDPGGLSSSHSSPWASPFKIGITDFGDGAADSATGDRRPTFGIHGYVPTFSSPGDCLASVDCWAGKSPVDGASRFSSHSGGAPTTWGLGLPSGSAGPSYPNYLSASSPASSASSSPSSLTPAPHLPLIPVSSGTSSDIVFPPSGSGGMSYLDDPRLAISECDAVNSLLRNFDMGQIGCGDSSKQCGEAVCQQRQLFQMHPEPHSARSRECDSLGRAGGSINDFVDEDMQS